MLADELRLTMRERLSQLPLEKRKNQSEKLCHEIQQSSQWQNSEAVLAFYPFRHEVDLRILFHGEKTIFLPRVQNKQMEFLQYQGEDKLERSSWGIMEPRGDSPALRAALPAKILILVPGLAFDKRGGRIGWGGGFYDRWLSENGSNAAKWGIAYEEQILDCLPQEPWDISMDGLVTPRGIKFFD